MKNRVRENEVAQSVLNYLKIDAGDFLPQFIIYHFSFIIYFLSDLRAIDSSRSRFTIAEVSAAT